MISSEVSLAYWRLNFCDLGLDHLHEVIRHVGVRDFRVHISLAGNGRCVAELLRDAFDRGDDVALCLGLAIAYREGFRSRTPTPPPFSSINRMPAAVSAVRILVVVSARPPSGPSDASNLLIVGIETLAAAAKSS